MGAPSRNSECAIFKIRLHSPLVFGFRHKLGIKREHRCKSGAVPAAVSFATVGFATDFSQIFSENVPEIICAYLWQQKTVTKARATKPLGNREGLFAETSQKTCQNRVLQPGFG
jgi:hypothetical protein